MLSGDRSIWEHLSTSKNKAQPLILGCLMGGNILYHKPLFVCIQGQWNNSQKSVKFHHFQFFMPLHRMMPGAYSFLIFRMCVLGYMCTCKCMYILLYECVYICTYIHTYVPDPVRLRLRHLYQVEFGSFIVRYPTVGASVDTFLVSVCLFFFCLTPIWSNRLLCQLHEIYLSNFLWLMYTNGGHIISNCLIFSGHIWC